MVFEGITSALNSFLDFIFGRLIEFSPLTGLFVVSLFAVLISTLAHKFFTNQELLKKIKEEGKALQDAAKNSKDNPQKMMELQTQALSKNLEYTKHTFMVILITIVPLGLLFTWLRNVYKDMDLNFLGFIDSWLWVYLIMAMALTAVLRKLFKVH